MYWHQALQLWDEAPNHLPVLLYTLYGHVIVFELYWYSGTSTCRKKTLLYHSRMILDARLFLFIVHIINRIHPHCVSKKPLTRPACIMWLIAFRQKVTPRPLFHMRLTLAHLCYSASGPLFVWHQCYVHCFHELSCNHHFELPNGWSLSLNLLRYAGEHLELHIVEYLIALLKCSLEVFSWRLVQCLSSWITI